MLFFGYAMFAAVDWLYSKIPVRFPNLKICLSEGGIGWVAGLLDRLEHVRKYDAMYGTWNDIQLTPAEVFRRNFWFCAIDDPSSFRQREVIGVENILVESDYPHADSTWPRTQQMLPRSSPGSRPPTSNAVTWRTRRRSSATRSPRRCSATPMRTDSGAPTPVVVDTPAGPVRGTVRGDGIARFGGVPYAVVRCLGAPEPSSWSSRSTRPNRGPRHPRSSAGSISCRAWSPCASRRTA